MACKNILKSVTLSIFLISVAGAQIINQPSNVATSVGDQTIINCTSSSGVLTWSHAADCNSASGTVLTDGNCLIVDSYSSHYRTETSGGFVCNLVVLDAMMSHGGCYVCDVGPGSKYQAMLVVVDSTVTVTTNKTDEIDGEDVVISVSVKFSGPSYLPPSFFWTLKSDPNQNITSYQGSTTQTSASSYIVEIAQKPLVPPYLCNLFFNPPVNAPSGFANNAPTYRISWVIQTFTFPYPPKDINISGNLTLCPDESNVLTCSAYSFPEPNYEWIDNSSGNILTNTSGLTIKSIGSYQCIASNSIGNVTSHVTVKNGTDCDTSSLGVNLRVFVPHWSAAVIMTILYLNRHWIFGMTTPELKDRSQWPKQN